MIPRIFFLVCSILLLNGCASPYKEPSPKYMSKFHSFSDFIEDTLNSSNTPYPRVGHKETLIHDYKNDPFTQANYSWTFIEYRRYFNDIHDERLMKPALDAKHFCDFQQGQFIFLTYITFNQTSPIVKHPLNTLKRMSNSGAFGAFECRNIDNNKTKWVIRIIPSGFTFASSSDDLHVAHYNIQYAAPTL